jgi:hypothetical protein
LIGLNDNDMAGGTALNNEAVGKHFIKANISI